MSKIDFSKVQIKDKSNMMDTVLEWNNLLIDTAIAKDRQVLTFRAQRVPKIPQLESVIVSGLLLRSVSLLDKALEYYMDFNDIEYGNNRRSLFNRLNMLQERGLLQDHEDIDSWRIRRNQVGHEVNQTYTWDELAACQDSIFRELQNLEALEEFPSLQMTGKCQRIDPPTQEGVSIEQDYSIEIKTPEKVYHSFGWKTRI